MGLFKSACIEKIYSVSILVGNKTCDCNCKHCAATDLRSQANDEGTLKNLKNALRLCRHHGGWSISLTSSGEPTLSPNAITKTLEAIYELRTEGTVFTNINLFTNGFEIARNPEFESKWLPLWKSLGLTAIAISVHNINYKKNLIPYNVDPDIKRYPQLSDTVDIVKRCGLTPRITLLLGKGNVDTFQKLKSSLNFLIDFIGVGMITCWPLMSFDGKQIKETPSRLNLALIKLGLRFSRQTELTTGHIWGGAVYGYQTSGGNWGSVRLTKYVSKHRPRNNFVRQLVLFQDGTLSYSWYQKGAICLK